MEFRLGGPIVRTGWRLLVIAVVGTVLSVFARAQTGLNVSDSAGGIPVCTYPLTGGANSVLRVGESVKDTGLSYDVAGRVQNIAIVVTCWQAKKGLAIELATTLESDAVAIYTTERDRRPVALRVGESVRDAVYVLTADKRRTDLPVTITCRNRGGLLILEMTATLDGKPVEFYADAENDWYALKPGENVPGTRRVEVKKGWAIRGLHVPVIDRPKQR